MTGPSSSVQPVPTRWSGALLTAVFLALAVVLFLLFYLALPGDQHLYALLLIGIVSLLFALGSYLAGSFSRNPSYQRALAWGFLGMGFAVLFLTVGLGPSYVPGFTTVWALVGLVVLIVVLFVTIALIGWRVRAVRATENQQVPRAAWRNEPAPSAFSYAAANSPSVPKVNQEPTNPPASPSGEPPRSP